MYFQQSSQLFAAANLKENLKQALKRRLVYKCKNTGVKKITASRANFLVQNLHLFLALKTADFPKICVFQEK